MIQRDISLRERIRLNLIFYMEKHGFNQVQLAEKLRISKGTVNNWIRGNNSPDVDMVPRICEVLGISILSLYAPASSEPIETQALNTLPKDALDIANDYDKLDSHGKRIVRVVVDEEKKRMEYERVKSVTPNRLELVQLADEDEEIPTYEVLYGVAAAAEGSGSYLDDCDAHITIIANEETRQADLVIKVEGRSMEPDCYDGDYVLVRLQPEIEVGEVGIWMIDGLGYIKERGESRLISRNPDVDDVIIREQGCRCVGKVIGELDPELIVEQ